PKSPRYRNPGGSGRNRQRSGDPRTMDDTPDDDLDGSGALEPDDEAPAARSLPFRISRATAIAMAPFALVLAAILVLTTSALLWVTSPQWGGGTEAGPR